MTLEYISSKYFRISFFSFAIKFARNRCKHDLKVKFVWSLYAIPTRYSELCNWMKKAFIPPPDVRGNNGSILHLTLNSNYHPSS